MARILFPVAALLSSMLLLIAGSSLLGTLLAVRLSLEGFSNSTTGIVMAAYAVGFVIGSLYAIHIVRAVGHIRAFAAFAAIAAAAVLMHPLAISFELWLGLRLVVGFTVAGLMLVIESWLNDRATIENRGMFMAGYMMLFYLASAAGQFLFALADPAGFALFSLIGILFALALVPVSLTQVSPPVVTGISRLSLRALFAISPLGLLGAFAAGVVINAFFAMGPVFATRMGFAGEAVALFMGLATVGALAFQWPAGFLSNYFNRRSVIAALALLGAAASAAVAAVATWSVEAKLAAVVIFMGFTASLYPVSVALTHDYMEHHEIASASAGLLLSYGLGTILGPIGGAAMMDWLGPRGLFAFSAGVLVILAAIGIYRVRRYPSIEVAAQEHFVPASPVSTPVLAELDPRNEEIPEEDDAAAGASPEAEPEPGAGSASAAGGPG